MESSAAFGPLDLAQRLPLGVVIFDTGGKVVSANPAATKLFGRPFAPGLSVAQLVAELGAPCAALAELAHGKRAVVLVGGHLLDVESQLIEGRGTLWLIDDKSEELRLRSQLAEEASLLAHSNEAFLVVDPSGAIRYGNAVCERDMGYDQGLLIGQSLLALQRACGDTFEDPQELTTDELRLRLNQVIKRGTVYRYNAWQKRRNGKEYPVEVSMRPYRMSQETVLLTTIRDESRRLQHLQDLVTAKAAAEAANRAKSAFLAITSHELRTPLTSIIGFCELLQLEYEKQPGNLTGFLKLIQESSQSLLNIINDILDLSKIEAKTMEIKVEPVDPDHLLDLLTALWTPRAAAKGLSLVRKPSTGSPQPFYSDPLRLRQVLDNLVNNAVKFTDKGTIEILLDHRPDDLVFTVHDTGMGIPTSVHGQLFQPFWQYADATTRAAGGTGLGLYICRQIAQLLGGTIWLDKSGGEGTAFKIRLPRNAQGQTGLHRAISDPDAPTAKR
jgi:PAS domain S-box-containing protein